MKRFPRARNDGSCSVAARFMVSGSEAESAFHEFSREWRSRNNASIAAELSNEPQIERLDGALVQVVFDAKPGSKAWKDLMVLFAPESRRSTDVMFAGFFDLISGEYHPASVRGRRSNS